MSRWLVTGADGLLGRELMAALRHDGARVTGYGHAGLDVTHARAVSGVIDRVRPDLVVNCAAWTEVDEAESRPGEAMAVNRDGAANVAAACAQVGALMVQVSTDYVFSGDSREPYAEDDGTMPRTVYGQTKLAGEHAVLRLLPARAYVVRTAWLYGAYGPNFVASMIRLARLPGQVPVVADQYGQPTWAGDVARQMVLLAATDASPGIYHVTSQGVTTWLGLAREVFRLLGADPDRVQPITTAELGRPAPRPSWSVLGHDRWARAGLRALPDWADSLGRAIPAMKAGGRSVTTMRAATTAALRRPPHSRGS